MIQGEYCTYHPQHPISMISLNDQVFPSRKICCQCLSSCEKRNDINEDELMTLDEFFEKLQEKSDQIIEIQKKESHFLREIEQLLNKCTSLFYSKDHLRIIQLEIQKIFEEIPRTLSNIELKMLTSILIHDFTFNFKIIEDIEENLQMIEESIFTLLQQLKEKNSINIELNIETSDECKKIEIPYHKTIFELRQLIEIPKYSDKIYFQNNKIKNENTTLFENNIWSNDILILKPDSEISFKLRDKQNQEFQFSLPSSETILTLKKLIQKKEDIDPSQQKILFYGRQLNDEKTIQDCSIENDNVLLLDINKTVINIFNIDEKPSQINLNPEFTFKEIQHEIQYRFDIPYTIISSISINNIKLQNNQQIQDLLLDVQNKDQPLQLNVNFTKPVILAKTLQGKILIIDSQDSETISTFKGKIENKYNIPISHQYIYYKQNLIENSKSLVDIGIKQSDQINISFQLDEHFAQIYEIVFRTLQKRRISSIIKPFQDIVEFLDNEIFHTDGNQIGTFVYFVKGARVNQGQCFSDFNIKENDIIDCSIKFRACRFDNLL